MPPNLKKALSKSPKDRVRDLIKKLNDGEQMYFALTPDAKGGPPKLSFDKKAITKDEGKTVFGTIARAGDTFTLSKSKGGPFTPALLKELGKLAPDKTFVEGESTEAKPVTPDQIEVQLAAKDLAATFQTDVQAKYSGLTLTPQEQKFPGAFVGAVKTAASTGDPDDLGKAKALLKMMQDRLREQGMTEREAVEEPIYQSMGEAFPTDDITDLINTWQMEVAANLDALVLTPQQQKLVPAFDQLTRGSAQDPDKARKILALFQGLVKEARLSGTLRGAPEGHYQKTPSSEYQKTPSRVGDDTYAKMPVQDQTDDEPVYGNAPPNTPADEPVYGNAPPNTPADEPVYGNAPPNTPADEPVYGNAPGEESAPPSSPGEPVAPKRAPNGQIMGPDGKTAEDHATEFRRVVVPQLKDLLPAIAQMRGLKPGSPEFTQLTNTPGILEALGKHKEADPKKAKEILVFFLNMMVRLRDQKS